MSWAAIEATGTWVGALATTAAVVVALWIATKEGREQQQRNLLLLRARTHALTSYLFGPIADLRAQLVVLNEDIRKVNSKEYRFDFQKILIISHLRFSVDSNLLLDKTNLSEKFASDIMQLIYIVKRYNELCDIEFVGPSLSVVQTFPQHLVCAVLVIKDHLSVIESEFNPIMEAEITSGKASNLWWPDKLPLVEPVPEPDPDPFPTTLA